MMKIRVNLLFTGASGWLPLIFIIFPKNQIARQEPKTMVAVTPNLDEINFFNIPA